MSSTCRRKCSSRSTVSADDVATYNREALGICRNEQAVCLVSLDLVCVNIMTTTSYHRIKGCSITDLDCHAHKVRSSVGNCLSNADYVFFTIVKGHARNCEYEVSS